MSADPILTVESLNVTYPGRGFRGRPVPVLRNVSLDIRPGETYGLVGESGSGKSTLGRAILGLAPVTSGRISFDGHDISHARGRSRRALAVDLQAIFQDPYSSLNPSLTVANTLSEPLIALGSSRKEARDKVVHMLEEVGLPSDAADRVPRAFSGGQRQRIAIARALALEPRLIVCDEPVSALDLTTQARVLDLLIEIQERLGVSYLFVSHDLAVIRRICHRVAVLKNGEIVESGECEQVTSVPHHDYTKRLQLAAPVPHPAEQAARRRQRLSLLRSAGETPAAADAAVPTTAPAMTMRIQK